MKFNILDLLLPREVKFFKYMHSQADIFIEGCELFDKLAQSLDLAHADARKAGLMP